jgi:protein gp37
MGHPMTKTDIEWTDETWNPVTGCTKVSPGCDNCYAEGIAERFRGSKGFPNGFDVTLRPEKLRTPLSWRTPRRVFVNSMSDLFHDSVPDEFIAKVWATMAQTPQHTYQILTKRHGRMRSLLGSDGQRLLEATTDEETAQAIYDSVYPLPNVWLGVSVEDQQRADLRVPALLKTQAAVRFLSCEPLLGPVDLGRWMQPHRPDCQDETGEPPWCSCGRDHDGYLDWVIVGGESGGSARPMQGDWARALRDQCAQAGVAFFFKQWGTFGEDGKRSSKHRTGRLLDGQIHDAAPERAA